MDRKLVCYHHVARVVGRQRMGLGQMMVWICVEHSHTAMWLGYHSRGGFP